MKIAKVLKTYVAPSGAYAHDVRLADGSVKKGVRLKGDPELALQGWELVDVREDEGTGELRLDVLTKGGKLLKNRSLAALDFPTPLEPSQLEWLQWHFRKASGARAAEARAATSPADGSEGTRALLLHQVGGLAAEMKALRAELARVAQEGDARVSAAVEASSRAAAAALASAEKVTGEVRSALGGLAAIATAPIEFTARDGPDGTTTATMQRRLA